MITLHQEFELHPGGPRIWIVLCLIVLVLALMGFVRVLWPQEGSLRTRRGPESPARTAAFMPGRGEPLCADLLGSNRAAWTAGPTAVPALFVVQPGTEALSIWLGRQEQGAEPAGSSYSSVWQTVSLPVHADSLTLVWSWRLQTAEEPAVPGLFSDRQQALLLDRHGELLEVLYSGRIQAARTTEQRHDLSPYAGETVRVYFNVYNDGDHQPTALRLDHWALMACQAAATPTGPMENGDVPDARSSAEAGWGPAAQGFSLWVLSILAFVALTGVGLAERVGGRAASRR